MVVPGGCFVLRILIACNAILALVLAIRLAGTGSPALAGTVSTRTWSAADLRVVGSLRSSAAVAAESRASELLLPELLLHLGADVATLPLVSAPVDLGLVAVPPLELTTSWQASDVLRVRALGQVLPATVYKLQFQRDLKALDGRLLAAGTSVAFTTRNIGLRDVVVEDDPMAAPGRGAAKLRVQLDLPIDPALAARCLGLRDAASEQALPVQVEVVPDSGDTTYLLGLAQGELPPTVQVVLAKGALPRRGSVPLPRDATMTVDVYEPLELRSAAATDDGLRLVFNRSVAEFEPALLRVAPGATPAAAATVSSRGVWVPGPFAPGSLVTVDLAAGFPGRGRSSLLAPVHRVLLVPDRPAEVAFVGDGEVLSARAEPVLLLRGCNVAAVHLRLRRVYANNIVRMLQDRDLRSFEPATEHTVPIVATRNTEWQERVDLAALLGTVPRGIYQAEVWHDENRWPQSQLLQITDLGVTVRAGADACAVQAVSIADGTPWAAATVRILTPTNQVLVEGTTDQDGVARLRWPAAGADRRPYVVQVQHGADQVFVGLEQFAVELADAGLGGRPYLRTGGEALVWPSRGVVRPGETLELSALVRAADGAAVADAELVLVVGAPGGKVFRRVPVRTPGSGLAAVAVALPTDAPCGNWSADLRAADGRSIGRAAFEVATFVPNRLEASVEVVGAAQLGEVATVRVHGHWLDGTAAAGRPVQVRVRLLPGTFATPAQPGFSFTAASTAPPPGELPALEGVLDARGIAELRLPLPPSPDHQTLSAVVMAEVLDPSGRPVRAKVQQLALPPQVLGVRAKPGQIDLCAVDAEGHPQRGGEVRVRIERRQWAWRYDQRDHRRWGWHSYVDATVVHEATVALLDGSASLPVPTFAGEGWLVAIASCGTQRAEQVLGEAPRAPDRLRVAALNRPAAGELAWLAIEAPAAGRAFVTLESDTVHAASVLSLQQGHNRVAVPVPAGLRLPNVHAVVTLTRPVAQARPGDGPAWLLGAADVPLQRDDVRAAVVVQVPKEVLPQQDLRVQVEAPGTSSAVVAVVDEGILAITSHAAPEPLAFFLASRRLGTDGADTGSRLVRDMVFAPRTKTGGDDDDLNSLLRGGSVDPHIRPLALFANVAIEGGRGVVDFPLPAYEGRLRVMVLVAGSQRFGADSKSVVVKASLGLLVAAPRQVAPGDTFVLPVTLRNGLGHDAEGQGEAAVPAGFVVVAGQLCTVPLASGGAATLEVRLTAQPASEGVQTVVVTATTAGARRSVAVDLQVRSARLPTREAFGIRLGDAQEVELAAGWAPEGLRAELRLDVAPDRLLRPALEAMLEYPYGCCEQTASRGMALASCAALLPRLYDANETAPAVLPLVQAAVDRLFAMQTPRGGFGWWLATRQDDAFLTVHVADFLLQAREVGAQWPAAAVERLQDRLAEFAAEAPQLDLRCHAIEVLARFGRPVQPRLDWLCSQPLGAEARARLATALALLGERRRAANLLQPGDEVVAAEAAHGAVERIASLASPLRAEALRVRARLTIDAADPDLPALVAALQRQLLRPAALTTQENAQAVRAVADYYRRQPLATEAPRALVTVDGAEVLVGPGRTTPVSIRPGSKVRFAAGGAGFVLLQVRGYAPAVARATERLELHREIVDPRTGLPTTQLRRGHVYEVVIRGNAAAPVPEVAIVDLLPGGCEAEPAARVVLGPADDDEDDAGPGANRATRVVPASVDARDDRVLLFCRELPAGAFEVRHSIRAVFPGEYEVPAVQAQAMYDPTLVAVDTERRRVEIKP